MQLGPRAQNPFASQPDRAPMSAARLAAEAAFAAPTSPQPAAAAAAPVVLRRSRLVPGQGPAAEQDAAEGLATGHAATNAAASKNARVFRVQAVPATPSNPVAESATPVPNLPNPPTRARRVGVDKRPGPVLLLVQAPAAVAPVVDLPTPPLEDLLTQLNLAGQVLQAAERAQSFRLDVDSCAKEWQQLSRKIESLRQDIRSQLR